MRVPPKRFGCCWREINTNKLDNLQKYHDLFFASIINIAVEIQNKNYKIAYKTIMMMILLLIKRRKSKIDQKSYA